MIRIYINLKIPDNIERTALSTCRNRLGLEGLASLRRTEFWEIDFPGLSSQQARQTAERLVEKTSLFANPNKHRWHIETAERKLAEETRLNLHPSAQAYILVCDREDGKAESTLEALRRFADESEQPASLTRGTLWELTLTGSNPDAARQAAENLAVTSSRHQGILANPHYQSHRIFYP